MDSVKTIKPNMQYNILKLYLKNLNSLFKLWPH